MLLLVAIRDKTKGWMSIWSLLSNCVVKTHSGQTAPSSVQSPALTATTRTPSCLTTCCPWVEGECQWRRNEVGGDDASLLRRGPHEEGRNQTGHNGTDTRD
eukprot:3437833-Rhodomonas_salina.1